MERAGSEVVLAKEGWSECVASCTAGNVEDCLSFARSHQIKLPLLGMHTPGAPHGFISFSTLTSCRAVFVTVLLFLFGSCFFAAVVASRNVFVSGEADGLQSQATRMLTPGGLQRKNLDLGGCNFLENLDATSTPKLAQNALMWYTGAMSLVSHDARHLWCHADLMTRPSRALMARVVSSSARAGRSSP